MNPKYPAEETILDLVPTSMGEFPLDQFPVLPVIVNQPYQKEILLESPLFGGQIGPKVVFIVVLELLVVSG
jgi:hypothetical protein